MVTKTHPALVDGLSAIDIGQVLLDVEPGRAARPSRPVAARAAAPAATLVGRGAGGYVRRPSASLETARGGGHRRPVDRATG